MNKTVNSMYFSPTGTTKNIVSGLAKTIAEIIGGEIKTIDFTLPEVRTKAVAFPEQEVLVLGVPVYAGRVPNILLKYLATVTAEGALAIPVVLYGNRNYDDALIELKDILEGNGFKVIGGGAFVGEHSFSVTLGRGRPDAEDMAIAAEFAKRMASKIAVRDVQPVRVRGNQPYGKYYMPKDKEGKPVDIRKVTPKTNSDCLDCKLCVGVCPMGSIDPEDVGKFTGICIKCGACIKNCPVQAKYYDDKDYLRHKEELEIEFAQRKEPELFF